MGFLYVPDFSIPTFQRSGVPGFSFSPFLDTYSGVESKVYQKVHFVFSQHCDFKDAIEIIRDRIVFETKSLEAKKLIGSKGVKLALDKTIENAGSRRSFQAPSQPWQLKPRMGCYT